MDELPNFLSSKNNNLKIKEEPEDENEESENINEEEEEEEEAKKDNNSLEEDDDSMDIDEDRLTLPQIRERIKKKQAKTQRISLLNKKTNRSQNITYDANTKSLRGCFIPDINQLNEFLSKCVVKEILEDESSSLLKDKKQDVFDPQEFMLTNGISKSSLSVEDLSLLKSKNKREKIPELLIVEEKPIQGLKKPKMTEADFISTSIYKSKDKENKEKVREQFLKFRKIMSTNILTLDQKKFLSDFIKNINALSIEEILVKDKKFEIVFDLDNTCMFSYLCNNGLEEGIAIKSKYKNKNIKLFQFEYQEKKMYSSLILRQGLKEFVEYIKDLANFHISTLASKNYAEKIAEMLANLFNIQFKKFSSRNDNIKNRKYINDLNNDKNILFPELSESNTIIFDDSVSVWENESFNVIPSKKFYDKELKMPNLNPNNKIKTDLDIFLDTYSPYSYNKFKEGVELSWKKQSIVTKVNCPFYQFKNKDTLNYNESFFAEYYNSPKYQFLYMKNVIKVLYCLVFYNDLEISDAIKLVRLNALNGKQFYLKFLNDEQKNILRDIIGVCGGEIYYPPIGDEESIIDLTKKIFLVVSKREYSLREKEIYSEIDKHKNFVLINEKFILDSYYFMTDLGESYKDKEYTDFVDDE